MIWAFWISGWILLLSSCSIHISHLLLKKTEMPLTLKSNLMSLNTTVDWGWGVKNEEWEAGNYKGYNMDGQREARAWTKLNWGWGRGKRCLESRRVDEEKTRGRHRERCSLSNVPTETEERCVSYEKFVIYIYIFTFYSWIYCTYTAVYFIFLTCFSVYK